MSDKVMRIIAGKYRHRIIKVPLLDSIKPTKDRIREALFSSLGDLSDKTFLDLFSGSGAIGIEALSRNASFVAFNDNAKIAIKAIRENINSLLIKDGYEINELTAIEALNKYKKDNIKFDIIYIDPPYSYSEYDVLIKKILDDNLLNDNGVIICESDKKINIDESYFLKIRINKYGEIYVTFLWRQDV